MASISKSKRVENFLRREISRGTWLPGERVPSEEDLSDKLGVSYMTVRNVMTRLSHDGLIDRRQRMGTYVADQPSVSSVAIVAKAELISSPSSRAHMGALEQARQLIERDGFRPVIKTGQGRSPEEFVRSIHLLDSFVAKEIVGVLTMVELGKLEERLIKAGIPAVSIVSGTPVDPYTVTLDYVQMTEISRRMLEDAGHDQFVLMYPEDPPGEANKPLAREWHRMRMEMVDGDRDRLLPYQFTYDHRHAYNAFKNYWLSGRRPGAVFFWDDAAFDVASRAILELSIDVPGELAFVTQGNANVYYHFPVPVTCVEFDINNAVAAAWELLDRRISGEQIKEPVIKILPRVRPGETL